MRNTLKKVMVSVLAVALLLGVITIPLLDAKAKVKKVSMTKKIKVEAGKTAKINLKNNKKKVKWKIKKGKKLIKITKKSKTSATVKGLKKGTAKVEAVAGKKTYNCTVTVSAAKKPNATGQRQDTNTPVPTETPAGNTPATSVPVRTLPPNLRTIVYDGTNKDEIENAQEPIAVVVSNNVMQIGRFEFSECSNLMSITIPNSVLWIDYGAFYNCSNLISISIPNSVTSIGKHAFCNCSSLSSITIPDKVTIIGELFLGCSSLTSIIIPDSVTSIKERAFLGCSNLTSITWKGTVYTSVDDFKTAFGGFE